MGEDSTIVYTARFDDGMEMDIKVCGVQFREGENNRPWTEAVLFRDGSEVACTEPAEDYFGLWEIEYEGVKYSVLVKPDPADEMLKQLVAEMIEHAEKAWEIGGQISNMLVPDGDDEVFDIVNEIQCCEETDVDSAVERLLKAAGEKEE